MTTVLSATNPQSTGFIDHKKMDQRSNQPLLEDRIVFVLASAIKVKRLGNNSLLKVLSLDLIRKLHQDLIGSESYFAFAQGVHQECINRYTGPNSKAKHDNPVFRRKLYSHMLKLTKGNEHEACCYISSFCGASLEAQFRARVTVEQEMDMFIEGLERGKPIYDYSIERKATDGAKMVAYFFMFDRYFDDDEKFGEMYRAMMNKRFLVSDIEMALEHHSGLFASYIVHVMNT